MQAAYHGRHHCYQRCRRWSRLHYRDVILLEVAAEGIHYCQIPVWSVLVEKDLSSLVEDHSSSLVGRVWSLVGRRVWSLAAEARWCLEGIDLPYLEEIDQWFLMLYLMEGAVAGKAER